MKRSVSILLTLLLLAALTGCSANSLFKNAEPGRGATYLYMYDGDTVYVHDTHYERSGKVLSILSRVPAREAPDWTPADVTLPIYGMEAPDKDGWVLCGIWSNGYWITQDGAAYVFDYDFDGLNEALDFHWSEARDLSALPCRSILSRGEKGWVKDLLVPADGEPEPPENITMTLKEVTDTAVTVELTNTGAETWDYGTPWSLQVLLDGAWYEVPEIPGNWGFTAIGLMLRAGESSTETCGFTRFGTLPAGTYRVVKYGLTAAFDLQ